MGSVPPAVAQAAAVLTLAALLGAPSGAAGQEIPDSAIVTVIAQGLQTVWALAEAPDGRLVVTEHGGLVRTIVEGEFAHEPWPELAVHEVLGDGLPARGGHLRRRARRSAAAGAQGPEVGTGRADRGRRGLRGPPTHRRVKYVGERRFRRPP